MKSTEEGTGGGSNSFLVAYNNERASLGFHARTTISHSHSSPIIIISSPPLNYKTRRRTATEMKERWKTFERIHFWQDLFRGNNNG